MPFAVLAARTGGDWTIRRRSASTHRQPPNRIESTVKKIFGTSSLASAGTFVLQSVPVAGSTPLTCGRTQFCQLNGLFLNSQRGGETTWGIYVELNLIGQPQTEHLLIHVLLLTR